MQSNQQITATQLAKIQILAQREEELIENTITLYSAFTNIVAQNIFSNLFSSGNCRVLVNSIKNKDGDILLVATGVDLRSHRGHRSN